jgi:L-iditol 2-dehydrogenase
MSDIPETTIGLGKLVPGPGNLGLREQAVRRPGPGEVLLEVLAAGICGTDLHIADDEFPSHPPVTMGHEVTGEVAAVGDGVDTSWLGVRVACETYFAYCEACSYCRTGRPNLCPERRSIGSHVDGGFARWLTLPARNLHGLPRHVGRHAGALTEPLACVANCLFDPAVVTAGDEVLVIGPGTMGVLSAQAARAAGGRVTVVGLDRDRPRLQVAAALGLATVVIDAGDVPDVPPPDVVCECSGAAAGAALGLDLVRKGGRYVQVGIFGRPVTVGLDAVLYKEVVVTSGFASTPRSWQRAMALLQHRLVDLDSLVTDVAPLTEWGRAFAATRAAEGMKFVIDPREGSP